MGKKTYTDMGERITVDRYRVLVVDDDEWICGYLKDVLDAADREIDIARTIDEAETLLTRYDYPVALCDVRLRDESGIHLLRKIRERRDAPEVIMITGQGSIDGAVEAVKEGAFDYLTKPLDFDRLLQTVSRAVDRRKLLIEVARLRGRMFASHGDEKLVILSEQMKNVMATVEAVSRTDASVLIEGESGTGKELIARAIHRSSSRADGPFVPVNCAALSESLLESELFGYVKGAFTGATSDKQGLFESAQHGTILLDEVGELSLSLQASLLRVLQNGEVRRVGSNTIRTSNARVIASTNRTLRSMVADGNFRDDLYYRLRIVPIFVPPLRSRRDDILPLTQFFLNDFSRRLNKSFQRVTPDAGAFLLSHSWPGNVRELENLVHGIIALYDGEELTYDQIAALMKLQGHEVDTVYTADVACQSGQENGKGPMADELDLTERRLLETAIDRNNGNRTKAAEELGISRTTLWRRLRKYKLIQPQGQIATI